MAVQQVRRGIACASVFSALLFAQASFGQAPDYSKVEFRSEKLGDNLFALFGAGGNLAVLTGPDGALVVDSELVELSPKLRAALALISDKPARFLINTHFHFDHAGGNTMLGKSGTVIVAHDNVRRHLMSRQVVNVGVDIVTEATAPEGLPLVTYEDGVSFHVNGEEVSATHVANGHTDSDSFVFFEKANVLHTGDLMMSLGYPFVDMGNGGSHTGLIAAHERMLKLCNEKTRVIPGHGAITDCATLRAYHDMLVEVRKRVSGMVQKGWTLEKVQAAAPQKEFDERWGKGFVKPEVFVQRIFVELDRARKKG